MKEITFSIWKYDFVIYKSPNRFKDWNIIKLSNAIVIELGKYSIDIVWGLK